MTKASFGDQTVTKSSSLSELSEVMLLRSLYSILRSYHLRLRKKSAVILRLTESMKGKARTETFR